MLGQPTASKKPIGVLLIYWAVSFVLLYFLHSYHYVIDQEMGVPYHSILIALLFFIVNLVLTIVLKISEKFVSKKSQFVYRATFCAIFAPGIMIGVWFWLLHHDNYYLWKTDIADYKKSLMNRYSNIVDYKDSKEKISRALQVAQYYLKEEKFVNKTRQYLDEIEENIKNRRPASKANSPKSDH